jgi:hypothetical protein
MPPELLTMSAFHAFLSIILLVAYTATAPRKLGFL